ncbi:MAG: signal peptidase I [Bacteroidales bacterium]|nr:signal peptidase I [Fournierella massiliensis]MCF2556243.1 signal peptidase I [Fournierella massiliensis]MCI6739509.1 signal peptidase I [Bacteroidales bacterium]
MTSRRRKSNQNIVEWYEALIFALAFLVLLFTFVVRVVAVNGSSMVPTLNSGDRLLVQSSLFQVERGDVVVIDSYIEYGKPLVKRVIAVGGDRVDINAETGEVFVNGQLLDEPYIAEATRQKGDMEFPLTVPEGYLFVMGDNRMHSTDSRYQDIGFIDERDILGQVLYRTYPFSAIGSIT